MGLLLLILRFRGDQCLHPEQWAVLPTFGRKDCRHLQGRGDKNYIGGRTVGPMEDAGSFSPVLGPSDLTTFSPSYVPESAAIA